MKKFHGKNVSLKLDAVFAALVIGLACFVGCAANNDEESDVPEELNTSNAKEVLGEDYLTKTSITIPNGVKKIGSDVFANSSTLKSITIPESVIYIADSSYKDWYGVFYNCTALQSIELPSGLTYLGNCAFKGCTALESVSIPEGIPSIGYSTFIDCISLESIKFPASIVSISESMCDGCFSIAEVTIPEGIKQIDNYAFRNCKKLKSITLPSTLLKIGRYVFQDCTSLESVIVKSQIPPEVGSDYYIFYNNQTDRKIYVPTGCGETYKNAAGWSSYADYIEEMSY